MRALLSSPQPILLLVLLALAVGAWAAEPLDPLKLTFHRLAARRFVFSNNLLLSELAPGEVVAPTSMHPAFAPGPDGEPRVDPAPRASFANGTLTLAGPGTPTLYVGGVNPYATYELDLREVSGTAEVAVDLATLGLGTRLQVVARYPAQRDGVLLRLVRDGRVVREQVLSAAAAPAPPCLLRLQLGGIHVAAFATVGGTTRYLGHTAVAENVKPVVDFRDRQLAARSTFNVAATLSEGSRVVFGGARSYLSAGVGQADLRMVTHRDGSPFWEQNRLWFTFSARGLNIEGSCQGVLSLDPSVFEPRFEGVIVYDHGDGLLRNDYSSHLFYDDERGEWCAWACDFGGVAGREGRGGSGLVVARSSHDPRRGFSVMGTARPLHGIDGMHEDPCGLWDAAAGKWRLLTCAMPAFHTCLYESDRWDGPYTQVAGPTAEDSTGVLLQDFGGRRYAFSGNKAGSMLVYSYPELKLLGPLTFELGAHWPQGPGRTWPNVFVLPPGFPYACMALTMDRPNFPDVKGPNWSYGALYLFGALAGEPAPLR